MNGNPEAIKKPNCVSLDKEENNELFDLETEEGCQKMLIAAFNALFEKEGELNSSE